MVEKYNIRTDLALEQKERFDTDHIEISGVIVKETYDEEKEIRITTVKIETENGARTMGKPAGTYITIEAPAMAVDDEEFHSEISEEIAEFLQQMIPDNVCPQNILVVGLGNRQVTPDALGPYVVDNLMVTRHIILEYGKYAMENSDCVSAIVPGVMGQTGMESLELIRGVVSETKPDIVIVIDALAARSAKRLNRTIQIADTGIHPGSGVGNHRNTISRETLGVPVIALGVPTVIDAATIVNDALENFLQELEHSERLRGVGVVMQGYSMQEKYELIKDLIHPCLNGFFVTPKDIDETVKRISYTISEGLNRLFAGKIHE